MKIVYNKKIHIYISFCSPWTLLKDLGGPEQVVTCWHMEEVKKAGEAAGARAQGNWAYEVWGRARWGVVHVTLKVETTTLEGICYS